MSSHDKDMLNRAPAVATKFFPPSLWQHSLHSSPLNSAYVWIFFKAQATQAILYE